MWTIFFLIGKHTKRNILEKDTLRLTQKHTEAPKGTNKKDWIQKITIPQLAPNQSKKLSKGRGPSFTTDLVHYQRLHTKEFFNLWIKSFSLSKAILFLSFQTAQKRHKGAAFHTFLRFLPKLKPHHPRRVSLTTKRKDPSNSKKSKQ